CSNVGNLYAHMDQIRADSVSWSGRGGLGDTRLSVVSDQSHGSPSSGWACLGSFGENECRRGRTTRSADHRRHGGGDLGGKPGNHSGEETGIRGGQSAGSWFQDHTGSCAYSVRTFGEPASARVGSARDFDLAIGRSRRE